MRIRTISILAVLALVLAACAGGDDAAESTTTEAPETTTTTQPAPDAMLLSYELEPGASYTFEVGLDQQINLTTAGDPAAMGEEELPGELSVSLTGTTIFTQTVAEGPEPDTFEITIQGDFSDLAIEGTIDGEPVETDDIPDFASMDPIDTTIIVDDQGKPIDQGDELGGFFGGGELGGLESFGELAAPGSDLGRLVGPLFSDEPVTVGDSWTETIETPMFMGTGGDPITTEVTSEVVDTDTIEGAEVLVIETQSVTSMISFDLAEFLVGFLTAFVPDETTPEEQAELDALVEDLRFQFDIDETVSDLTTWFDAEAGVARQAEFDSSSHIVMDIAVPDEESGELIEFVLDMDIDQAVDYRLTDSTST